MVIGEILRCWTNSLTMHSVQCLHSVVRFIFLAENVSTILMRREFGNMSEKSGRLFIEMSLTEECKAECTIAARTIDGDRGVRKCVLTDCVCTSSKSQTNYAGMEKGGSQVTEGHCILDRYD